MSLEINIWLSAIRKTINEPGIVLRFINRSVAAKKGADQRLLAGFMRVGHGKAVAISQRVEFSRIGADWQKTLASTWFPGFSITD